MTIGTRIFLYSLAAVAVYTSASAQKDPVPQPTDVDLGTLRVGTLVESNFLVWWHDKSKSGKAAKVEPPPFARVLRTKAGEHSHSGSMTRVWFVVDTKKAGPLKGSFRVTCEGSTVKVPIEAVVLPRSPLSMRVLMASTPFDAYATDDSKMFTAWRRVVDAGKLEVHYVNPPEKGPVLSVEQLQRVDVVVVGRSGLYELTEGDVKLLHGFVSGGGRLLVTAAYFYRGTVAKANELIEPFGLRMDDEEPRGGGAAEVTGDDIVEHAFTKKVESLTVHRPTPTRILDPERARRLVKVFPERAYLALSETESGGEVIVLGQSLLAFWAKRSPGNERLLRNLLTRKRRR